VARRIQRLAGTLTLAALLASSCGDGEASDPAELDRHAREWPAPNHDLQGTRAVDAEIHAGNVAMLRRLWRFRINANPRESGSLTATPIVLGDTVYVQDMLSNVFALDRETGRASWSTHFGHGTPGPNGLAAGYGRIYGATDTTVFALDQESGRKVWARRILTPVEHFVDVAPVVANGLVYTSTVGFPPGGRGALYALDALTGRLRWKFVTIEEEWRYPRLAGGGGAWFPVSVDEDGLVYAGNSNPAPWGGTRQFPNGAMFPGPTRWTDSLLVLDGDSGRLVWADQVTPHDVRDYDFQASPILAELGGRKVVFGAGKAGRVIAWDREQRRRVWEREVGVHLNDEGSLPRAMTTVCPGLYGGVETSMAYADGRLFVPVVDLCVRGSAVGFEPLSQIDVSGRGTGRLVALDGATGRRLWERRFADPVFACATVSNEVVFTVTFDGWVHGLHVEDGRTLWRARMRAGVNACPAVAGGLLVVGAGIPHRAFGRAVPELVAFGLPR
jgi:outer membrane protein assembly factor BamB